MKLRKTKVLRKKNPTTVNTNVVVGAFIAGAQTTQENAAAIIHDTWKGAKNASASSYRVSGMSGVVASLIG